MLIDVFDPTPDAPRTLLIRKGEGAVAAVIDGFGSWGSGAEAARWTLTRLGEEWAGQEALSELAVAQDVARVVDLTPNELRNDDLGWGFAVAVIVCKGAALTWYAAGSYSVHHFLGDARRALFRPRMLVDDLIASGASEAQAAAFTHAHVVLGPFVGDGKPTQLSSGTCVLRPGESLTVMDVTQAAFAPLAVDRHLSARDLVVVPGSEAALSPAILCRGDERGQP
jgi:hypothetical protein